MKKVVLSFSFLFAFACNNRSDDASTRTPVAITNQEKELATYAKKGDSIVAVTFDTLSKTLMQMAKAKGFPSAVELCNVQALPLTSILANEKITIKRSSKLIRNLENEATADELAAIDAFAKADSLKNLQSVVSRDEDGIVHYYKPIVMQSLCLNCHGHNITPDIQEILSQKYPKDQAIGYSEGDLRGIWHIYFKD